MDNPKNLLCFLKRKILYIYKIFLETETPKRNSKKGSFISGGNLQRPKKKSALKKFVSYNVFAIFTSVKHIEIPCEAKNKTKI